MKRQGMPTARFGARRNVRRRRMACEALRAPVVGRAAHVHFAPVLGRTAHIHFAVTVSAAAVIFPATAAMTAAATPSTTSLSRKGTGCARQNSRNDDTHDTCEDLDV
jgi:hypothetical protein